MVVKNGRKAIFEKSSQQTRRYPVGQQFRRNRFISHYFRDKCIFTFSAEIQDGRQKWQEIANLISKLNFYKLIPYPMDNCYSGRRRPARQMPEKDVLCFHRLASPSTVHSPGGAWYLLPV